MLAVPPKIRSGRSASEASHPITWVNPSPPRPGIWIRRGGSEVNFARGSLRTRSQPTARAFCSGTRRTTLFVNACICAYYSTRNADWQVNSQGGGGRSPSPGAASGRRAKARGRRAKRAGKGGGAGEGEVRPREPRAAGARRRAGGERSEPEGEGARGRAKSAPGAASGRCAKARGGRAKRAGRGGGAGEGALRAPSPAFPEPRKRLGEKARLAYRLLGLNGFLRFLTARGGRRSVPLRRGRGCTRLRRSRR